MALRRIIAQLSVAKGLQKLDFARCKLKGVYLEFYAKSNFQVQNHRIKHRLNILKKPLPLEDASWTSQRQRPGGLKALWAEDLVSTRRLSRPNKKKTSETLFGSRWSRGGKLMVRGRDDVFLWGLSFCFHLQLRV